MKKGTIEYECVEKGDYVWTPEGIGIVAEVVPPVKDISDLFYLQIIVKLKEGNKITSVDRIMTRQITYLEYENN